MCGIGGAINYRRRGVDTQTIEEIGQCIAHRGPDDYGFFFSANGQKELTRNIKDGFDFNVALLHRRLSILDLSERGWQPMQTPDKRYTISYNGEVYNYLEIRETLAQKGYQFHTGTDTEVILFSYQEWGVQCLSYFNGMFAFAIHDALKNEIFVARDPFGIKPLYYVQNEQYFIFCSEIKGLLADPKLQRTLNYNRLKEYLKFGWVNQGTETVFNEIRQLPAAHYALLSADTFSPLKARAYWEIQQSERTDIRFEEAVAQVKEIMYTNVKLHLRSDVEVGYTLSGGIDSSTIIGAAQHIFPQIQPLSFSYLPNYEEKSEKKWIDIVNARVHARPHYIQPSEGTFISEIEEIIRLQDEPFGSTSIYAQYKVFELVHNNGVKVVLDGQGADEIFAGYPLYFSERALSILKNQGLVQYLRFIQRIDPALNISKQKQLLKTLYHYLPSYLQEEIEKRYFSHSLRMFDTELLNSKETQFDTSHFKDHFLKGSLYKAMKHNDLPSMLRYQDRNAMAFSVEGRVPFLTKNLVEFVYSLPEEFILPNEGYTKKLLREAMRDFLPVEILNRRDKIGFETPEKKWIANSSGWTLEILNQADSINGIQLPMLKKEFEEIFDKKREYTAAHWRYLNFIRWAKINKVA